MNKRRIFFLASLGVVVAAACGGSSTGGATADGGDSGSPSESGSGADSSGPVGGPNPDGAPTCTKPSDCASGQVCIGGDGGMIVGGSGGTCRTPCTAGTCDSGQICCTGVPICRTGSCPLGTFQLCSSATDCPAPQTCMAFGGGGSGGRGGGPMICQAACTGGSCGSGQVCCTAGNLFQAGPTACQMGTSCPRGAYQLCSSNADCSSGEMCATVARAADGGAGATYCFAGVADAGAGGG